jgi:hypothetical protein
MSLDKDSIETEEHPSACRPPAVSERLWNLIDPSLQRSFIRKAALALRKGVHPEDTMRKLLKEQHGWSDMELDDAMASSVPEEVAEEVADSADVSEVNEDPEDLQPRPPVWAFGTNGYDRSGIPVSLLGEILLYQCGYDAPTASEMEWLILRAVSRDPSFVMSDIENLRLLGCALPSDVVSAVRNAVLFECRCVIDDVRRRRDRGDLTALTWIDPDELVF